MLKHIFFIFLAAIMASSLAIGESLAEDAKIVAIVNNESLTSLSLQTYIKTRLERGQKPSELTKKQQQNIINDFINRELIYQDAVKNGLDKHPVILAEIDNQRRNITSSFNIAQLLRKPPTEAEMKSIYEQQFSKPGIEFKTRHILVNNESQAKAIIVSLNKGGDFIQIAKKWSIDASANNGGELNWLPIDRMVPGFAQAITTLKKGTHSQQPVKTRFGWHVIRLEGTRQTPPPSFEEVQERIISVYRNRKIAAYINNLRKNSQIEIK